MSAPPPIPTSDPGVPAPSSTSSFWHQPPNSFLHAHRTTASLPSHAKTIIIGSGMAGSMLFYHLTQHSPQPDTLMLEARSTCWGATGRNGGHCKPMLYSHNNTFSSEVATFGVTEALRKIRFEQLNLELMTEYVRKHNVTDAELIHLPSADIYFTISEFQEAQRNIDALRKADPELGALLTVHDGGSEEGRTFINNILRTPAAVGAVTFPAAKLWPYKVVSHILTNAVKEHGLNLQTTTPALSITRSSDKKEWVVSTPRGDVTAEKVIVAANAHTAHLLPVMRGWIYPVRAQMSALEPPKSLREKPLTHSYGLVRTVRRMADYLIQRPIEDGGELMLGGGRDFAEDWGIGKQDATIDRGVASFLRNAIGQFFGNETGFPGEREELDKEDEEEEGKGLRQSFIERFRRLRVGGHSVWDLAEGIGMDEEREPETPPIITQQSKRECKAKAEWTGTLGFSKDERPFIGRVPAVSPEDAEERGIPAMENTTQLYMLAGFEGHGMAFTSGSAKALAAMITADEKGASDSGIFQWFPSSFEVTPERLGLKHSGEWVVVDRSEAATTEAAEE